MVNKLIGYYGDRLEYTPKKTDQLAIEIANDQITCLIKNSTNGEIDAFEIFQFNQSKKDWSDIFFEVKQSSKVLGPTYSDSFIFYNFEEALILPLSEMSATASSDFLSLVYGEDERSEVKFDRIDSKVPTVAIYRLKKSLIELLDRNFLIYKSQHCYTHILNEIYNREIYANLFLKLIVYHNHIVLVLIKDKQLQLIQSYIFKNSEDILYQALHVVNQLEYSPLEVHLELSGMIDTHVQLVDQLKLSFGVVSFDILPNLNGPSKYSPYFLTPFYKLLL